MNYELDRLNNVHYKLMDLEQEIMDLKSHYVEQFNEKEIIIENSYDFDVSEILSAYKHILTTTQKVKEFEEELELLDFIETLLTDKGERDTMFESAREMGWKGKSNNSWWKHHYEDSIFKQPPLNPPLDIDRGWYGD